MIFGEFSDRDPSWCRPAADPRWMKKESGASLRVRLSRTVPAGRARRRYLKPSPLVGEGGERQRAGEGGARRRAIKTCLVEHFISALPRVSPLTPLASLAPLSHKGRGGFLC